MFPVLDQEEEIRNRNKHARSRKRILSKENDMRNRKEPKHDSLNKNLLMSNENESDDDDNNVVDGKTKRDESG